MLFKKKNWPPTKPDKAFKIKRIIVKSETIKGSFNSITYGEFALVAIHDVNNNNKLDTRWFPPGMPAEDISISNNAKGGPLGPPAWEEAKFELKQSQIILTTQSMNYFYKK